MALSINLSSQSLQYQIGGTVPTAQSLVLNFGGFLSAQYSSYSNVKLRCIINSGIEEWAGISGSDVLVDNEINSSSTSATVNIDFIDINLLSANDYHADFIFLVTGIMDGEEYILDQITHRVNLQVSASTSINTDKFIYNIQYLKSTNTFSGDTLITLLNNTGAENCSIQLTQAVQYFAIADASFSTSTHIIAGADLAQLATATANPLGILAALKNSAGTTIANFSLKVAILENDEFVLFFISRNHPFYNEKYKPNYLFFLKITIFLQKLAIHHTFQ
jgi:hypothetical protein